MTEALRKAIEIVGGLSTEAQNAIASEILAEVAHMKASSLTPEQQAEVERRMSAPLDLAEPDEVAAVFEKY